MADPKSAPAPSDTLPPLTQAQERFRRRLVDDDGDDEALEKALAEAVPASEDDAS